MNLSKLMLEVKVATKGQHNSVEFNETFLQLPSCIHAESVDHDLGVIRLNQVYD